MLCLLLFAAAFCLVGAALVDNGTVVTMDGIPFYVGGIPLGHLAINCSQRATLASVRFPTSDLLPMTIIDLTTTQSTELLNTTKRYTDVDDVFQLSFLRAVYLRTEGINITTALGSTLAELGTTLVITAGAVSKSPIDVKVATGSISAGLPKGPYFVSASTGKIFMANRLYSDENLAFIQGVVGDGAGGFTSLPALTAGAMTKSIAVPSRLYYTPSTEQPLSGLRLGVKDIFHVKGVGTSGGNRAYYSLYGAQNATGPAVQRLLDLGAVLVGKMGTVQFANGDRVTADWVDLHAPFNPRGDGYQDPSGSSTGPGAGIGAYEWLDIAVGSDTGGSMRGPAGAQGIFGNRPSTGAISMEHVIPLSPVSDTAGVFARSGITWATVTQAWYANTSSNYTSYPKTIYRSLEASDWTSGNITPAAAELIDNFAQNLENFLQVNSTIANYTAAWEKTHPSNTPTDLAGMLYYTYGVFVTHDQWSQLGKPFFADYAAKYDGRQPFINPGPLIRWQWGQVYATDEIYAQALTNISIFKSWWETEGYGRHDVESCSEGLYIYPWFIGEPSYRNKYFDAPTGPPLGFGDSSVPVMTGTPEVIVPLGEIPYNSTVTLHTEYLPVSMALRMARGCDHVLAGLVRDLEQAGVLRGVSAGPRLYP